MSYKLYLGDCIEVMKGLPDNSIDVVMCDPPYGTTQCKWDTIVPLDEMWNQIWRVSKSVAPIVLFSQQPFTTTLNQSSLENFKYDWIWNKTKASNFQQAKNMPLRRHEIISIFSKGVVGHRSQTNKRITYNPQGTKDCDLFVKRKPLDDPHNLQRKNGIIKGFKQEQKNYPDTLLLFNSVHNPPHPTQKPVPLMEYLIKTYSDKGDTILDFTMGSGTTGVAAMNLGRKFIGIEKDLNYYRLSQKRIGIAGLKAL